MIKNINLGINKTASKQSNIKNKYLKYKQKYLDLKQLIGGTHTQKRILVLTDVGEECDDEAALWMMLKVLGNNDKYAADVVFCTGNLEHRRNRWAKILERQPIYTNVKYFYGNNTGRHVRNHPSEVSSETLTRLGLNNVLKYPGGEYDVVLQISPIGDETNTELGNLENVKLRKGAENGSYVLVGTEGSTNFSTTDSIHKSFKDHLLKQKFLMSCVEAANYTNWHPSHTTNMNSILKTYIYNDEWNKAIGRIAPDNMNLFVRFRVNCSINYNVIKNTFDNIQTKYNDDDNFKTAITHWDKIDELILYSKISHGYIQRSNDSDYNKENYGNPNINNTITKDNPATWIKILSPDTQQEFKDYLTNFTKTSIGDSTVNDVMMWALVQMTKRMAIIWVFIILKCNKSTDNFKSGIENYCTGSLNFNEFPTLPQDIPEDARDIVEYIQQCFMGNPSYDPSGMFVALALLDADPKTRQQISERLSKKEKLLLDTERSNALVSAYNNSSPKELLMKIFKSRLNCIEEEKKELDLKINELQTIITEETKELLPKISELQTIITEETPKSPDTVS